MIEDRFLENLSMFSMLSLEELHELYTNSKVRQYTKNQVLFYEGDTLNNIYVLFSGYVRIEKNDADDQYHYLDFLNAEHLFPVVGIQQETQYSYTAITQTDVEVVIIPIIKIKALFSKNIDFMSYWIRYQSDIMKAYMTRIQGMSINSALDRIVAVLKLLAQTIGEKNRVTQNIELRCPIPIKDIATMTGTTRETAGIMMKRLQNMGCMEYHHKHVVYLEGFLGKGGEL